MRVFIVILVLSLFLTPTKSLFARSVFGKFFGALSRFNKKNREGVVELFDNFYEVEQNAFYRSQQLSEEKLGFYLRKHGIRTLINLRGDDQKDWWLKEKAVAEDNGVLFFSIPMSAVTITKKQDLITLLTIYAIAQRPMLVHCIGGADRTGEASAIWVLDQQGKSKEEALKQLSIKYGHRTYKNSAKDFLIQLWQGREWVVNSYNHEHYPQYLS